MKTPDSSLLRELAPRGRVRAAINFGNPVLAQSNPATGEPQGVSVDIARELGEQLHIGVDLVTFDAAGKVFDALKTSAWDIAFLAIDPVRATEIAFSAPYVVIEGSYIVRNESPCQVIGDFDRADMRIAVGKGAAYDLFLTRTLKYAELVRTDTSSGAIDLFHESDLDAAAGVRQPLEHFARSHSGLRVIDGRFTAIEQAMGVPKNRPMAQAWVAEFVEQLKASGFIADALKRHGQRDATVAPIVR